MLRASVLLAAVLCVCAAVSLRAQEIDLSLGEPLAYVPPPLGMSADVGTPLAYVPPPLNYSSNSYSAETYVPPPLTAIGLMADQNFNSGTIYAAGPITFGSAVIQSLGSASSAANYFPNRYDGTNLTFIGAVHLFNNNTLDQRITVNNTTTFAGGWSINGGVTSSTAMPYEPTAIGLISDDSVNQPYSAFVTSGWTYNLSGLGTLVSFHLIDGPVLGSSGITPSYTYLGDANLSANVAGTQLIASWLPASDVDGFELMPAHVELVPEPSTVVLSGGGFAMLLLMWRRRFARTIS